MVNPSSFHSFPLCRTVVQSPQFCVPGYHHEICAVRLLVRGSVATNQPSWKPECEEINVQHHPSPEDIRDRLTASQVQKDAKELAEICAVVTTDMDSAKKGLLPKDAVERLKRLEKLSKRMRENLTRVSAEH